MKKILSISLAFLLSATSFCFGIANASSDDDYISVPISIPDNLYNVKIFADCNDVFNFEYYSNALSWYGHLSYRAMSIESFKSAKSFQHGNVMFSWKNQWQKGTDGKYLDSDNKNTLILDGIEYNMVVNSADCGGSAIETSGNYVQSFNVTPGYYSNVNFLAQNPMPSEYNKASKSGFDVVLTYSDGSEEMKNTGEIYLSGDNSVERLGEPFIMADIITGTYNSSAKTTTFAGTTNEWAYSYIKPYVIKTNENKILNKVTVYAYGNSAALGTNGKYVASTADKRCLANIYAITAVTKKSIVKKSCVEQIKAVNERYNNENILTNTSYSSEIKDVLTSSASLSVSADDILKEFVPKISAMQISGTYGEGNALSISKTVSDSFGRPVTLSDIKWYKSDTITTDETAWTQIGTGETYTMQASDVGSYIYVTAVPTCEAVSGIPEIKTTGDRKISDVFFRIVAPEAKYAYFKADRGIESTYVGEEISLNYGYEDLNGDIEDGTVFTFEKSSTKDGEYTAVQTSTDNKYVVKVDDLKCFVRCKVKVKNTAEKGDEATEKISENVYFVQDDKTSFGTKLFGEYKENKNVIVLRNEALENGVKDVSAYEWYTTDKMTNAFPEGWTKSSENTQLFNISSDIFGKYVAVAVTPKTEKSGVVTEGDKIVKYFYSQQSPVAYDVKITSDNTDVKNTKSGDKLTGTYKYADPNGDSENGTKVLFEKSADGENWETLVEDVSTYELTENDTDMYIRFSVIPKSGEEPENTGEKTSSESFVTPFAPEVTNPTISGTASAGNTLTASYTFSDKNGNADVDSEIKWYAVTSSGKTLLGTGKFYAVNSSDYGKSIIFEITPKTNVKPLSGATVASASVAVTGGYVYGGSSGGSISTGSGGGGSSYKGTATTPNEIPQYTPVEKEKIFYDIENHWAEEAILSANEKGYMTGYEKKFRPDDSITRAEISAVVCRVLGLETEFSESFSDVTSDLWYAGYVGSLYNAKIVSGSGDAFYPGNNVTREEFAKIIVEAYKYKNNVNNVTRKDLADFSDSNEISQWATDYVEQACGLGLFAGDTFGRFNPKAPLTRAEACVITERFSNLK